MFPLNNQITEEEFDPNIIQKSKKRIMPIVIFLITFTIISVLITGGAILYKNSKIEENKVDANIGVQHNVEEIKLGDYGINKLTEKYNENDLEIKEILDKKGTYKDIWGRESAKTSIVYDQIKGLKDKQLEERINNEIKESVYSLYNEEELNDNSKEWISIRGTVNANFGNILSISIYKYFEQNDEVKYYYKPGLNYNLNTGEKIAFQDLFVENTSVKNILAQSIYDSKIYEYTRYAEYIEGEGDSLDMKNVDLTQIEEETFLLLNQYSTNTQLEFYITYYGITVSLEEEETITINVEKFYKNLAYYKKYLSEESIFDGTFEGEKNIFIGSRCSSNIEEVEQSHNSISKDIYDNFRISIHTRCDKEVLNNEEGRKIYTQYCNKIKEDIEKYATQLQNNKEIGIIYNAKAYVNKDYLLNNNQKFGKETLFVSGSIYIEVYQADIEYYSSVLYEEVAKGYRETSDIEYNLMYLEDYKNDKNVKFIEYEDEIEPYDLLTGKTEEQLNIQNEFEQFISMLQERKDSVDNSSLEIFQYQYEQLKQKYPNEKQQLEKIEKIFIEMKEEIKKREIEEEQLSIQNEFEQFISMLQESEDSVDNSSLEEFQYQYEQLKQKYPNEKQQLEKIEKILIEMKEEIKRQELEEQENEMIIEEPEDETFINEVN